VIVQLMSVPLMLRSLAMLGMAMLTAVISRITIS
jgi:hypothetical protein